jgi:prepilin peptidase CpaA
VFSPNNGSGSSGSTYSYGTTGSTDRALGVLASGSAPEPSAIASLLAIEVGGGIVFGLCLLCWLRGWMGGGDVKLLGACALLVPPLSVFPMITTVGMAGGVLAFLYLAARRVVPRPVPLPSGLRPNGFLGRALRAERWRLSRGVALPYAVAIAIGSLASFP